MVTNHYYINNDGLAKSPSTGRARVSAGRRWGWNHPNSFRMSGEEKSSPVEQKGAKRLFARSLTITHLSFQFKVNDLFGSPVTDILDWIRLVQ